MDIPPLVPLPFVPADVPYEDNSYAPFLPSVMFHVVYRGDNVPCFSPRGGWRPYILYSCPATNRLYAILRLLQRCQGEGSVYQAVRVEAVEGRYRIFCDPLGQFNDGEEHVCIKVVSKAFVAECRARRAQGLHVDEFMLDKATTLFLMMQEGGEPDARGGRLLGLVECWHDARNWYAVAHLAHIQCPEIKNYAYADRPAIPIYGRMLKPQSGMLLELEAKQVAGNVCGVLATLHRKGLCHRDISPENILLGPDQGPRLIDFGCGERLLEGGAPFPPPRRLFCKRAYAPPEYLEAAPWEGVAYDMYTLGITLYELLFGGRPYGAWENDYDDGAMAIKASDEALVLRAWRGGGERGGGGGGDSSGGGGGGGAAAMPMVAAGGGGGGGGGGQAPFPPPDWAPLHPPPAFPPYGMLTPFEAHLVERNNQRFQAVNELLSQPLLDLLSQLIRIRFRPVSMDYLLDHHPWFRRV